MTEDELLCFIGGGFVGILAMALLQVFNVYTARELIGRFKKKPGIFTWRQLDSGEEEVILDDGRVFRGKGIAWYASPSGVFAPDWLSRWLSEQSRAARMMHAVGTERKFVFEMKEQKRRERRDYGDN